MLPNDYPDDFVHDGLDDTWFRDVPWAIQARVMSVDAKMRAIRNPATSVFVVVLKLNPQDPQQTYPFFGVRSLYGWAPLVETEEGHPVEALHRIAEGMERSREYVAKHYGETPAQMAAVLASDAEKAETARVNQMLANTRFARVYGSQIMREARYGDSNSPELKQRYFADAQRDFLIACERRRAQAADEPLIKVP